MKNSSEFLKHRIQLAEENVSKLETRLMILHDQKTRKGLKQKEEEINLSHLGV